VRALINQRMPADDGVELATDVFLPDGPGPFPAVVVRTPYHRVGAGAFNGEQPFVERGYAYVVQDCRGKYDSDGDFTPLVDEARDGQANLDWVANQKWCNGKIGLWGRSYLGMVQVPAAAGGHEALKCIIPSIGPASYFTDWLRYDGCFAWGNAIRWAMTHASCRNKPDEGRMDWYALYKCRSFGEIAEKAGFVAPILKTWLEHDTYDEYWKSVELTGMHSQVGVPGYHMAGWFDHINRGQFQGYRNISDHGATEAARTGQKLIVGPWGHINSGTTGEAHTRYGDWEFGPDADVNVMAHEFQCLDFYLKEIDNGWTAQPPVRLFVMGENRLRDFSDWPPPEATQKTLFLSSGGGANMKSGDGALSEVAPDSTGEDSFSYDPDNPVPMHGGAVYWGYSSVGPVDQRPILDRTDVLYYRTAVMESPLAVIGEIGLDVWISSDAEDTDIICKLCVEDRSGAITVLTNGSIRCRYRDGWDQIVPLTPGEPTRLSIDLGRTAYLFEAGSKIGLIVTSSEWPRILPNPNRFAPIWEFAEPIVAKNSVLHGPGTHSKLTLSVVDL